LRMILPPRPTKGLGRHESTRRIDQRQTCQFIAPVERETRQNFPAEKSGTHAVSGEAESVMHAAAAAEDRQMRRGHIDRPPHARSIRRPRSAGKKRTRLCAAFRATPTSCSSRRSGSDPYLMRPAAHHDHIGCVFFPPNTDKPGTRRLPPATSLGLSDGSRSSVPPCNFAGVCSLARTRSAGTLSGCVRVLL
jgi:hypothetical protein